MMTRRTELRHWSLIRVFLYGVIGFMAFSALCSARGYQGLMSLPENSRYFQYKGLPCVLFSACHPAGWSRRPNAAMIESVSEWANLHTITLLKYRYSDYQKLWDRINDDDSWAIIEKCVKNSKNHDMVVHGFFFDGAWNIDDRKYGWRAPQTFIRPIDDPIMSEVIPGVGVTRIEFHKRIIQQAVRHLWPYQNVIFDIAFEIHLSPEFWDDGTFIRWWVEEFRKEGKRQYPTMPRSQLFGIMNGSEHPQERGFDLLIGEFNYFGFPADPRELLKPKRKRIRDYRTPLVRMGLTTPTKNRDKSRDYLPIEPVDEYPPRSELIKRTPVIKPFDNYYYLMRSQILTGIHTSVPYGYIASSDTALWWLQLRTYLENIETWKNEPTMLDDGDEIHYQRLPHFKDTTRPELISTTGYERGAKRADDGSAEFKVIYKDLDNDPPRIAEVWVDRNADGRFDPNPAHGERITMRSPDTDYRAGATFTASGVTANYEGIEDLWYVFRFADEHWTPPSPGGTIPSNTKGISYEHWAIPDFKGMSQSPLN